MPGDKGYDDLEIHYPGVFAIDRARTYVDPNFPEHERAYSFLSKKRYYLVLLDFFFIGQRHNGPLIQSYIRMSRKLGPNYPSTDLSVANKDSYIIGVSEEWERHVSELDGTDKQNRPNAYTSKAKTNKEGLIEKIDEFLRQFKRSNV